MKEGRSLTTTGDHGPRIGADGALAPETHCSAPGATLRPRQTFAGVRREADVVHRESSPTCAAVLQAAAPFSKCIRCSSSSRGKSSSYCNPCHAANMRHWRKTHPMNAEQRFKDNARSYAACYKKRGKLVPEPCEVSGCESPTEMHHPDYTKPLEVRWLCRDHHLVLHSLAHVKPSLPKSPNSQFEIGRREFQGAGKTFQRSVNGSIHGGAG